MSRPSAGPLAVLDSVLPPFTAADAREIARCHYGLEATGVHALTSERDRNFRLRTPAGDVVLKIANAAEDPAFTDFQLGALEHIAARGLASPAVPVVRRTQDGADRLLLERDGVRYLARVVSYVDGVPLEAASLDTALCRDLGAGLARLGRALAGYAHPGSTQPLAWDMKCALALRAVVDRIAGPGLRQLVVDCLDDFERFALPRFPALRTQAIHNDFNPANVLLTRTTPPALAGVIDFGDLARSPLIVDVAVGAAYLRTPEDEDPLGFIEAFVAGYSAETALARAETDLLYDLVATRLATTVALLEWRRGAATAEARYLGRAVASESSAAPFLLRLRALPRAAVAERLAAAAQAE